MISPNRLNSTSPATRRAGSRIPMLALALSPLLLLGACFGGGGDSVVTTMPAPNTVPSSATASPEAFSRFVGSLAIDDRGDPLDLTGVVPPTSDTDLPISVG